MTLHLPTNIAAILTELDHGDSTALNSIMEFDSPITVHEDGTVTDGPPNVYAPSLYDDELDSSDWELLDGYSGQYGYSGPVMHPSEFIGGGMARDILATPGTYVAIAAYYSAEFTHEACGAGSVRCRYHSDTYIMPDGAGGWIAEDGSTTNQHEPEDQEADGWAVARLIPADDGPRYVAEPDGETWRVRETGTDNVALRGLTREAAETYVSDH